MLAKYAQEDQTNWRKLLIYVSASYNASKHSATGFSPNELMFSNTRRSAAEVALDVNRQKSSSPQEFNSERARVMKKRFATAHKLIEKAKERDRKHYNKKRRDVEFNKGDKVWLFTDLTKIGLSPKLSCKWHGPYVITKKLSKLNYELAGVGLKKLNQIVNIQRLKQYDEREIPTEIPELSSEDKFDWRQEPELESLLRKTTEEEEKNEDQRRERQADSQSSTRKPTNFCEEPTSAALIPRRMAWKKKKSQEDSPSEEDEVMYEFEKIVEEKKKKNGKSIFRVRWKGYSAKDDTWEPAESFSDPRFINNFRKEVKRKEQEQKEKQRDSEKEKEEEKNRRSMRNIERTKRVVQRNQRA
jgi:hypothetical protein